MVVRRVLKGAFSEGLKKSFNHYNEGLIMGLNHLHATGGGADGAGSAMSSLHTNILGNI